MRHFYAVLILAKLNASEWIRLKFFHIVIFFAVLFLAFSHLLSALTFSVQERLLYDFGLAGLEIGLVMIGSLIGSHTIQREIDRKTLFVLLSRPIPRSSVVLGGWLSIFLLSVLFTLGFLSSLILTANGEIAYKGLFIAAFASLLKALVITSFSIACGLIVRPLLALVATVSYWILCYSVLDIQFFATKLPDSPLVGMVEFLKKILPEFYAYNWKSYYYIINVPSFESVLWAVFHSLAWICLWLFLATMFFRKKEIV
jgi:ABC-type transport system involved in multi-copper enzyme maturation permease subunit